MHILPHLLLLLFPLFDGTTGKAYVEGLQAVGANFDRFTNYEAAGPAFFHSFTNNVCSNCCPNSAQTETGIMQQSLNQFGPRLAAAIHEYPRRVELEIARQETSKWLENCLEQIGDRNPEMRDFLSYWKDTADAPDTKTKFMIVAIVFIVAFVVALIGMVFFAVLYFSHRK